MSPTAGAASTPSTFRAAPRALIKWKFDPGIDRAWAGDVACCGVNNRGVALWKDKVISIALDGRMFELNKATGEKIWERKIADPALGETITMAPLVIRDLAIVGPAGGEFGIRGFIDATDLNTGQQAWRTYTIPAPANPATIPGRTVKIVGSMAARQSGKPPPMMLRATRSIRASAMPAPTGIRNIAPGDNKWAASVLAINPNNGKIKWGFQYTPNDPFDFDEISEHPVIDTKVNGKDRKLVVHAARNGFFYALDRTDGAFVGGKQYVDKLNWTTGLDPETGLPANYDPQGRRAGLYRRAPTACAATRWRQSVRRISAPRTGSRLRIIPKLNLIYIPSVEGCDGLETVEQKDFAIRAAR